MEGPIMSTSTAAQYAWKQKENQSKISVSNQSEEESAFGFHWPCLNNLIIVIRRKEKENVVSILSSIPILFVNSFFQVFCLKSAMIEIKCQSNNFFNYNVLFWNNIKNTKLIKTVLDGHWIEEVIKRQRYMNQIIPEHSWAIPKGTF